ncbi:MAG: DnaB-like helicase C-terminal domain-containing protein, partial [Alistipes sp.]
LKFYHSIAGLEHVKVMRPAYAIEYDADIVAFIHRPEYYGFTETEDRIPTAGLAEIILAKHRNGAVTDVRLKFLKDQAQFTDYDDMGATSGRGEQYDTLESGADFAPSTSQSALRSVAPAEFNVPGPVKSEEPF